MPGPRHEGSDVRLPRAFPNHLATHHSAAATRHDLAALYASRCPQPACHPACWALCSRPAGALPH
eukprot:5801942-Alexandrium_andersonii.AAC.1